MRTKAYYRWITTLSVVAALLSVAMAASIWFYTFHRLQNIEANEQQIYSLRAEFHAQQLTCQEVKHTLAYNNDQVNSLRYYCQEGRNASD